MAQSQPDVSNRFFGIRFNNEVKIIDIETRDTSKYTLLAALEKLTSTPVFMNLMFTFLDSWEDKDVVEIYEMPPDYDGTADYFINEDEAVELVKKVNQIMMITGQIDQLCDQVEKTTDEAFRLFTRH